MGLFDNLFLDQNTPITINDGIDHSKDEVMPIVDPSEGISAKSGSSPDPKDDTKKDDSVSDLFESDKKDEKLADAVLVPEPPKDVALEIGMAPADPSMAVSNFDIGGDVSFDTLPESNIVVDGATVATTEGVDAISAIATNPEGTPPLAQDPNAPEASLSGTFLGTTEGTADAGALLGATPDVPAAGEIPAAGEAAAPETGAMGSATGLGGEGGIFGLIGGTEPAPAAPAPVAAVETPNISIMPGTPEEPMPLVTAADVPTTQDIMPISLGSQSVTRPEPNFNSYEGSSSSEVLLGRDALALFTQGGQTSGLLREKLNSFIEDLKALHSRDQSQRYHKLEQIAMYEERIREIDAEAATRKRVLQSEIDDLKRQIEKMDREKNDIQEVISTFNKEVERG